MKKKVSWALGTVIIVIAAIVGGIYYHQRQDDRVQTIEKVNVVNKKYPNFFLSWLG